MPSYISSNKEIIGDIDPFVFEFDPKKNCKKGTNTIWPRVCPSKLNQVCYKFVDNTISAHDWNIQPLVDFGFTSTSEMLLGCVKQNSNCCRWIQPYSVSLADIDLTRAINEDRCNNTSFQSEMSRDSVMGIFRKNNQIRLQVSSVDEKSVDEVVCEWNTYSLIEKDISNAISWS